MPVLLDETVGRSRRRPRSRYRTPTNQPLTSSAGGSASVLLVSGVDDFATGSAQRSQDLNERSDLARCGSRRPWWIRPKRDVTGRPDDHAVRGGNGARRSGEVPLATNRTGPAVMVGDPLGLTTEDGLDPATEAVNRARSGTKNASTLRRKARSTPKSGPDH